MKRKKKYLRMSRMFVLLIFFAALLGRTAEVLILYGCVLVHECAHLALCRRLHIRTEYMAISPYGMELRMAHPPSPQNQVKISAAGPCANLLMFIGGYFLMSKVNTHLIHFFVQTNFVLFVFNLIPCVPLDGSEILRSIVSARGGIINSYRVIKKISLVIAVFFFVLGALYFFTKANPSLLVIAALAAQNICRRDTAVIFAAKEIFLGHVRSDPDRIKTFRLSPDETVSKIVRHIGFSYTLNARFECGGKVQTVTQDDIIRAARVNPCMTLGEVWQKYCIKSYRMIENEENL